MHGRAAVRTPLLEDFAAERAELAADRIGFRAVGQEIRPPLDFVRTVRRAVRIRTEPARRVFCRRRKRERRRQRTRRWLALRRQVDAELLRELLDDLVVQLRPVTLLEHRQRRLLAADFKRHDALRKLRGASCLLDLQANLWTEFRHGWILWTLFYQLTRGLLSTLSTGI